MFAILPWSCCQSDCRITTKNKIYREVSLLDCDLMWKRFVLPDYSVNGREKGEHPSYSRAVHGSAALLRRWAKRSVPATQVTTG